MKILWAIVCAVIMSFLIIGGIKFLPLIYDPIVPAHPGEPNGFRILRGDVPNCNDIIYNETHLSAYCKFKNTDTLYCKIDYNAPRNDPPSYWNKEIRLDCHEVVLE